MVDEQAIKAAQEKFGALLRKQLERVEVLKGEGDWTDYSKLDKLIIGVCGGDGIGPYICASAQKVMEFLLADKIKAGKVEIRQIDGLTIERRVEVMKAIPDDTLAELKKCHVILKGPTTTPKKGDPWPNIESANVAMRKELDLFANVRPVSVPELGINWTFFRENTEGSYVMGSDGLNVTDDLAMDFCVATTQGTERIIRLGFDYAAKNNLNYVSLVTKANIIKTTDGKFLSIAEQVAKDYPQVRWDDWFIDIATAKLIDPARRSDFRVFVLPNLYGDIITDEAAQIQGGVGTAGSANLGKRYAMFEAIHGSAPRMVTEGRAQYADPCSMIKAVALMMNHIGEGEKGRKLEMALDICCQFEKKLVMTGRNTGATGDEFAQYVMDTIQRPDLEQAWNNYVNAAKSA
ncbi:MAG: isocitrate/isopropylmalate dehydrogenase family protein [Candidatus Methanomethylophilaceae archaeon]|jgi:isocitrate dehydrogenase (NAD+)|nr:isocitrate/isopropylmalate dehydrogenase family protein [Thermoplasmata archaeon]MBR3476877.1 isocitrate/isopropylmalate dehydrogenase family protein [Candidatus Methanomethylophilaceae archaeon]MBR4181935.1 isocitrate/isopropylmalate dehydrogenase family protein [Candidatus Methanomethylophilaceae archaeon]MBR4216483.1 isocitrate/isopropylmalate dehydrogenase family protein [Candidatus Methanomethylophilaceae archaeon]MBR4696834.1 isocitrate/isopropylmalate dehydrogenase family protein [Can